MISRSKKQQYIFINTDIYLEYFEMSSATKTSLEWLLKSLKKKELKLILPKQVEDEFLRRKYDVIQKTRENIIKKIPQELNKFQFPVPIKNIPETKKVKINIFKIKNLIKTLVKKYDKECSKTEILIKSIFKEAEHISDDSIVDKAYQRFLKGNPPGKNKSYGDAIIWQTLLEIYSNNDLTIITEELDWYNDKDKKSLKEFLISEWKEKTKKKLKFNLSLAAFINEFTGKETIKKKIVEEEKITKEYFPNLSGAIEILNTPSIVTDLHSSTVISPDISAGVYRDVLRTTPSLYPTSSDIFNKKICPNCFTENEIRANFCFNCGKKFS